MTIQTAVLIETLVALGAEVRWASCNIFSTQDHAAAAVVVGPNGTRRSAGRAGVRLEGRDARGVLVVHRAGARLARRPTEGPNMILDDGGDATCWSTRASSSRRPARCPTPGPRRQRGVQGRPGLLRSLRSRPEAQVDTKIAARHQGRHRGDHHRRAPPLRDEKRRRAAFPAINVNDSVTKSKFDNKYGCRHSLSTASTAPPTSCSRQGRRRLRLRRRRQGLRAVAEGPGRPRHRHRDRPDLRAAGRDGGLPGHDPRGRASPTADIFITATGNFDIITAEHMADEEQGDRRQHRPLRQRDRHGGLAKIKPRASRTTSSRRCATDVGCLPRRPRRHRAVRGPPDEPRQRHRPPELRDVELVLQPGDRPDRAVHQPD
jgi:adenosylhomocysteinase